MNYFYKEKGYYYIGFDYRESMVKTIKSKFNGKYNPANREWYVQIELWNLYLLENFLKAYNFVEICPKRKRDLKLSPIRKKVTVEDLELVLPELGLKRELRRYQLECLEYMLNHNNPINALDVGLGKTLTTIAYIEVLEAFPCVVIAPATVKEGWMKEWKMCNPQRSISIINSVGKKDFSTDVVIINYDLLGEKISGNKAKVKFQELLDIEAKCVVADEIHFLKNSKSIRSKAFSKLTSKIDKIVGLSGTISMNRPSELYNILKILKNFRKIFPDDFNYYHYRYCNMRETRFGKDISSASNLEELNEILSHYCYFRKEKREVLKELPPITEQLINTPINNSKKYKEAEKDLIKFLKKHDKTKVAGALKANQLVQLNVLHRLSLEGKMKFMELYIKEWMEGNENEKLVVFGIYKDPLIELTSKIKGSLLVTGDLSLKKKMSTIEDFKTKDFQVLFANIDCIGTGVDGLQEVCSNAIFIELPMKPSSLAQAIGRLERSGQMNNINITYLLNTETIDNRIWKILKGKKEVTDTINKGYVDDISLQLISSYVDE